MTGPPYYIVLVWRLTGGVQLLLRKELPTFEEVKELVEQNSCVHGTAFGTLPQGVTQELFRYAHP